LGNLLIKVEGAKTGETTAEGGHSKKRNVNKWETFPVKKKREKEREKKRVGKISSYK